MDNIVQQLRNEADGLYGENRRPSDGICYLMRAGAAEIERLKELIAEYVNAEGDHDHDIAWWRLVQEVKKPESIDG
jgi:hypothetical protein